MAETKPLPKRIIWAFAIGYFVFYAPYAGTVKIISSRGRSAAEIFPSVVLGTIVGIIATLTLLGWWRYARVVREPRRLVSGIATASQWGATTIAYTFSGISIVLAVLLMRAGVLTLAPVVDLAHKRRVRWFAWAALILAMIAVVYALAHVDDYSLPLLAAINLGFYLGGYAVRLPTMTKQAKTKDRDCTQQYFVDEAIIASIALFGVTVLGALLPIGTITEQLRFGFANLSGAGFAGGLFYAGLHLFGTMIYLDWRENAFCISLNRCTSIFAGIVASLAVSWNWNVAAVPQSQLVAAGIMFAALLLLSPAHHVFDLVLAPVMRRVGKAALSAADAAARRAAETEEN
ncbi:MAG TPA: hypothetical protein VFV49_14475 [Thermoanaerobaculia bacterium]|nr:hypothetical protein [Thermoanaerobaculia bacterium]